MILLSITRVILYIILGILGYLGEINRWALPLLLLYDWQYFIAVRYNYFSRGGSKKQYLWGQDWKQPGLDKPLKGNIKWH